MDRERHPHLRNKEDMVMLPALSRVAVCGGTHGNELSGVYLVRERLKKRKKSQVMEPAAVVTVMSNPRAVQRCVRYTEMDLNRCFTDAMLSLSLSDQTPYELVRSQELNSLLGPKGSAEAVDLICDLHNTTANMGLCLITYSDSDWICLHICKYLQREMATIPVRYIHYDIPQSEAYSLDSVGKHGFAMEIGPQPHGLIRANIFMAMQEAVQLLLDWVRLFNSGAQFEGGSVDVYTLVKNIDYPRDPHTHTIIAAVHPDLQDRDFCLLHPGDPMFLSFSGETLRYKGKEPLYPFFINESAYYEKAVALSLARRRKVEIPAIRSSRT
ncbi:N-acyl-aromatic-L-amino acid amidohydrolase (carboxylate-forming) B-like [Colossoma macropomum]|uniref:N-acyl-aromatic-L-amino acid amidohydrolase (carboxylate-forming) B-like n=1 Tax=Colossoma macropomum TaxID=42526 RepID=UPI0018642681|nr:N-acyl-aromatic-L-amino acid amidohydrolase (carboxylate-forming) B-like [Colossoma macropomum]